jgi:glycogen phosphorylase
MQTNDKTLRVEDDRTGFDSATLKQAFLDNMYYVLGKPATLATLNDCYLALAYTVRDRMLQRLNSTSVKYTEEQSRTVCYLSAEFLLGPHLGNNLINLGLFQPVQEVMKELDLDLHTLLEQEEEPGLGNGGLGRLAACYLDSLASLEIPALGYGIRYEFGIFDQDIKDGWQVELTDKWLRFGNPWELLRPEWTVTVPFGGKTETYVDSNGHTRTRLLPNLVVKGVPYDTPILGYQVNTANTLRLWKAEAPESFDFQAFNMGDYYGSINAKVISENITKVLYPNDDWEKGKELRLQQQFFFVSCSLQDMLRIMDRQGIPIEHFHEKFAVQLNDTHPAISVAELMRLLVDQRGLGWDLAWEITQKTLGYTNHTLMPEALERWSTDLFGRLLPRHLEIIYEINHHFLAQVRLKFPDDAGLLQRLSLIDDAGGHRTVRMANLACVGSHAINGVAALHSELLKQTVLKDFYAFSPEKFSNKTNGVTPRRFMVLSNPQLADLITRSIGSSWITRLDELQKLTACAEDAGFRHEWRLIKQSMKIELGGYVQAEYGITLNPNSIFDILAKRIHEYKRQHLKVLHIITLYNRLKANPDMDMVPRTFMFGGKAAPGYRMAKLIIKLVNAVADVVNNDPDVRDRLKVVFLKNYNVKFAQHVYPAADLSEQISTAGLEASGTGNMKFAMNGALTVGTLDGANVEIREEVGAENFFLFGLTTPQVKDLKAQGYLPRSYYQQNAELRLAIDSLANSTFAPGEPGLFQPIVDNLLNSDPYMLLADYQSYIDCQDAVSAAYRNQDSWVKMSILNTARMGKFSSDRSIREYCQDIWQVRPVAIDLQQSEWKAPQA